MNILNPGVYIVGFSNPSGVTQFIKGSDISPSSTLTKEVLTRGISSGGNVTQLNYKWELEIQFADRIAFQALQDFPKNQGTSLEIWKTRGFFTWREPRDVFLSEAVITDPESEDYPYSLTMTFIGPDPIIKDSQNYLAPWKGVDTPYWELSGVVSSSFDDGVQTITTGSSLNARVRTRLFAPFRVSGQNNIPLPTFEFHANILTLPDNGVLRAIRQSFNADGSFNSIESASVVTTTGNQMLFSNNINADIAGVRFGFEVREITEPTSFSFRDPYIVVNREDGSTLNEFVNF